MANLKIYLSILERHFPFYFMMDRNGTLFHMGPSMEKLCLPFPKRPHFDEIFVLDKKPVPSVRGVQYSQGGDIVSLIMKNTGTHFRGEVVNFPRRELKLFIVNLVAENTSQVAELGLTSKDFAIHDPIFEYLEILNQQKLANRKLELLNAKITEAQALAAAALQAKSVFLANMSHELRTPLTGILGMASLLEETSLDDSQKEYLSTLSECAESVVRLINDILNFSKMDSETPVLHFQEFSPKEFLYEILDEVTPLTRDKGLRVSVDFSRGIPEKVVSDPRMLSEVMRNILKNAIKFTEKGGVSIYVDRLTKTQDGASECLRLSVRDTGIGMNEETLSNIFAPFVQGDSSLTKKYEGVGLGLSLSHRMVDALGGSIQVESLKGRGSNFTVTIPLQG